MGGNEKFSGFDFVSATRGAERLGEGLHWPALDAAQSINGVAGGRGYHAASVQNARYVYSFR
jgi:hypothetical protein